MAASSKIDFDDLDSLPVAATPPQGDRKRKSISKDKTSEVRGYRYDDPFAGDSLWMHVDLADGDANGSFKPVFKNSEVSDDSAVVKEMIRQGRKLSGSGFKFGVEKIKPERRRAEK